jgi:hypothetical protein
VLAGTQATGYAEGIGTMAMFHYPAGIALSNDGLIIYVGDQMNCIIRQITSDGW